MKSILFLFVCLEFLIGSVYLQETDNEIVKSLAADIVKELQPHKNARYARHIQMVTETAIDRFLESLRSKYEKQHISPNIDLKNAANELRKKMKKLRAQMQQRRHHKLINNAKPHGNPTPRPNPNAIIKDISNS